MATNRIVIAGAGSIGCFVGGMLAAAGRDVAMLARSRVIAEIQAHGLRLTGVGGPDRHVPALRLTLSDDPAILHGGAVILVAVKSADTAGIADLIARHAADDAVVVSLQNGPRGPSDPNDKSGGMSPITMAILAMLAYKGYKHFTGNKPGQPQQVPAPTTTQANAPDSGGLGGMLGRIFGGNSGQAGGGLGGLLKGPLGGLLAGGAAGGLINGGLGDLLKQFQQNGQGETAQSWVSNGPNRQIAPNDLANALGADQIDQLTSRTGMSRDQLLSELSNELPDAVNEFTPDGRLPTEDETTSRLV